MYPPPCCIASRPHTRCFHTCHSKRSVIPRPVNFHYFRIMLKKDVNAVVTRWDHSGWSALHYAAYNNKYDIMVILIASHIDLQQPNIKRQTPLHLAAIKGNWSIAEALLNQHVLVDAVDKDGHTPLAHAMKTRKELLDAMKPADRDANTKKTADDVSKEFAVRLQEARVRKGSERHIEVVNTDKGDDGGNFPLPGPLPPLPQPQPALQDDREGHRGSQRRPPGRRRECAGGRRHGLPAARPVQRTGGRGRRGLRDCPLCGCGG